MTQAVQNQVATPYDPYWEKFEKAKLETRQPSWLFPIRKAAISRFAELGFPTTHDEDWRFTNVAPIAKLPFKPVLEQSRGEAGRGGDRQIFLHQPEGAAGWCS